MNRMRYWIILCLLISLAVPVWAQTGSAPAPVNGALQDLSSRVGQTITLDNQTLEQWQWEEATFNNGGLGCPEPGVMYTQALVDGYIFYLTYQGTLYEYHTDTTGNTVVLCSQTSSDSPTPTPELSEQFTNPVCPTPTEDSGAFIRNRIKVGNLVIGDIPVNRLRQQPDVNSPIITEITRGAVFAVLQGPVCTTNGIVWWQVDYDGVIGWVAEGQADQRYIIPLPAAPLPSLQAVTVDNASTLTEVAELQGNFAQALDFSPTGTELAIAGGVGSNSIVVYDLQNITAPRYVDQQAEISTLVYHPNGQQVFIGATDGGTHLYNVDVSARLLEALYIQTHSSQIEAIAPYPDGESFATAGTNSTIPNTGNDEFNVTSYQISNAGFTKMYTHTGSPIVSLAYAPDGSQLAAATQAGQLLIWDTLGANIIAAEQNQASVVAYSPNGQFFIVGTSSGSILLYDAANMNLLSTITGHLDAITDVEFSPDTAMIASTSTDGTLRLWSTQSDAQLAVFDVDSEGAINVSYNVNNQLIAAMGVDGNVRLYGIPR